MTVFVHYVLDDRGFILTFGGVLGLFALTFVLYDLPVAVYADGVLFASTFVLCMLGVRFFRYFKKSQQLTQRIHSKKMPLAAEKTERTFLEAAYEQVITTEQQVYQQEINTLKQNNQSLMDYYSMWSHQIKTPLAVLNLKMQENALDQVVLKQELFKIDQYLAMMLQYLRMNHTETDFVFEEIAVDQLIKDTVKKFAPFFIYKDLTFTLQATQQTVVSDKKWVRFVLEQVLFNGIKYTHIGGLTAYANPQQPHELIIADSGIGILPEDIARVFERGYTGFNGRIEQNASGLGLFMCREVMRKLGHDITLTSTVGVGTKVHLVFTQKRYPLE